MQERKARAGLMPDAAKAIIEAGAAGRRRCLEHVAERREALPGKRPGTNQPFQRFFLLTDHQHLEDNDQNALDLPNSLREANSPSAASPGAVMRPSIISAGNMIRFIWDFPYESFR